MSRKAAALALSLALPWGLGACNPEFVFLGEEKSGGSEESGGNTGADTTGTDTGDGTDSTDGTDGTDSTDTGDPVDCDKLDLVFVLDNTQGSNYVILLQGALMFLDQIIEPRFPDYRIGFVRTNDATGTCHQGGAMSGTPDMTDCMAVNGSYASPEDTDVGETLICLAEVGAVDVPTDSPRAALATARALAGDVPPADDPGFEVVQPCNAGFLRPDAVHAVVLAVNEDDITATGGSPGDPADWFDWLAPREEGGTLVIASVLPMNDCGAGTADRTQQWLDMHAHHAPMDSCAFDPGTLTANLTSLFDEVCP